METLAWRLADFAHRLSTKDIPAKVVEKAELTVLDVLGNAIANYKMPASQIALRVAKELSQGNGKATLWVDGSKARAVDCVLAHGVLVHCMLRDESLTGVRAHLGSMVISTAFAVGEENDSSGDAVLAAIVAGFEVAAALGGKYAISGPLVDRGFSGNGSFGAIGASVTASKLMGSDAEQTKDAICCAANFASGLLQSCEAGAEESFLNGNAPRNGILAAMLAKEGLKGADDMLEGRKGFLSAFAGIQTVPENLLSHLGREFRMMDIHHKPHPTCGNNKLAAIITQKLVLENDIQVHQVEKVRVILNPRSPSFPGVTYQGPFETIQQALLSGPFAIASMIKNRNLTSEAFLHVDDPVIAELASHVTIEGREGMGPAAEDCEVQIVTKSGKVLIGDERMVDWRLTFRDRETGIAAFRDMTSGVLAESAASKMIRKVLDIAKLRDINELTKLLALGL